MVVEEIQKELDKAKEHLVELQTCLNNIIKYQDVSICIESDEFNLELDLDVFLTLELDSWYTIT